MKFESKGIVGAPLLIKKKSQENQDVMYLVGIHKGQNKQNGIGINLSKTNNYLIDFIKQILQAKIQQNQEKLINLISNELKIQNDTGKKIIVDNLISRTKCQTIKNGKKILLQQFLESNENPNSYRNTLKQIIASYNALSSQNIIISHSVFRDVIYKFINLELNQQQQEQLFKMILELIKLITRQIIIQDQSQQYKKKGQQFKLFFKNVFHKTKSWMKKQDNNLYTCNQQKNLLKPFKQQIVKIIKQQQISKYCVGKIKDKQKMQIQFLLNNKNINKISNIFQEQNYNQTEIKQLSNKLILKFKQNIKPIIDIKKILQPKGKGMLQPVENLTLFKDIYIEESLSSQTIQQYFTTLKQIIQTNGKKSIQFVLGLQDIGRKYSEMSSMQIALSFFLYALQILIFISNKSGIYGSVLTEIGQTYYHQGLFDQALKYLQQALQVQRNINGKETVECAIILNRIGQIYEKQGRFKESIPQLLTALKIQEMYIGKDKIEFTKNMFTISERQVFDYFQHVLNMKEELLSIYGTLDAKSSSFQHCYEKSLLNFKQISQQKQKMFGEYHPDCAILFTSIGIALFDSGDYQLALNYHSRALQIQQKIKGKNKIDCDNTLIQMSKILFAKQCHKQAIQYLQKLFLIQQQRKQNQLSCAQTLAHIGLVYYNSQSYDRALSYFLNSLELIKRIKRQKSDICGHVMICLGRIYEMKNKQTKQLFYYLKGLQIFESLEDRDRYKKVFKLILPKQTKQMKRLKQQQKIKNKIQCDMIYEQLQNLTNKIHTCYIQGKIEQASKYLDQRYSLQSYYLTISQNYDYDNQC